MILYFSATGNSRHVAKMLAEITNDRAVDIVECIKKGIYSFELDDKEKLGIVAPVYFWGLPQIVVDFIRKSGFAVGERCYVYHVATCGSFSGGAHRMMEHALNSKGLYLHGKFYVRMVDTWTPVFNLSDEERNLKRTENADRKIRAIAEAVKDRTQVTGFGHNKFFIMLTPMIYSKYTKGRKTSDFYVESACTGCGLCAERCPLGVLEMAEGLPVWKEAQCNLCLSCLHRCPVNAIQYGSKTKGRGQFVHPDENIDGDAARQAQDKPTQ